MPGTLAALKCLSISSGASGCARQNGGVTGGLAAQAVMVAAGANSGQRRARLRLDGIGSSLSRPKRSTRLVEQAHISRVALISARTSTPYSVLRMLSVISFNRRLWCSATCGLRARLPDLSGGPPARFRLIGLLRFARRIWLLPTSADYYLYNPCHLRPVSAPLHQQEQ